MTSSPAAVHSAPQGNGTPHLTSSGSNIGPSLSTESLLPRPFRLESLGITPSNGKVKRKKSKTHLPYEGNWESWARGELFCNLSIFTCHPFWLLETTLFVDLEYLVNSLWLTLWCWWTIELLLTSNIMSHLHGHFVWQCDVTGVFVF